MAKEYDILYGEANGVCKELKGVSEVAEFICTEGLKGDVEIFSEDLSLHITTFGISAITPFSTTTCSLMKDFTLV